MENINHTGGIVAGALPLLYGMAEDIVVGATYEPAPEDAERPVARPAVGPPPLPAHRSRRLRRRLTLPTSANWHRIRCHSPGIRCQNGNGSGAERGAPGSRPVVRGPVVGAEYSPIHSSFHAGS